MKVPKMMIDYTLRFGIPLGLCYAYWNPRSDEEIRRDVVREFDGRFLALRANELVQEAKMKPDVEARKKKQLKFAELLLQKEGMSDESKQQVDQITAFTKRKKEYLADRSK